MSNYGFDIQEANDLSKTGKLYVGLKTYLDSGDIGLSEKDLFGVTSNLMDGRDAFIQHSMRILDVDPNFSKTATAKVEKLSHLINTLLSDITVPGFKSNIIKKTNLKLLLGKLRQNSDYKELVHLSDLEGIDMDDEVYKYKVKMLFESRLINSYLKKMTKKNDDGSLSPEAANWRKYVGLLMYLTGGSMTNQLTEVRYLDEMKNYTINHNKALTEPIAQFVNGKLDLDLNTKSGFVLFDPYTRDKYIKMVIDSSSKHKFKNQIKLIMNKIYLKRIAKSPKILARESIDLENLQIVK
jgi:phosphoribosylformylglycinamidine (FGAM) synthase PurS component